MDDFSYLCISKLANDIVTAADDKAAAEVFYWGLIGGEQGVADGSMPTGMADMDIRHKPKRNKGKLNWCFDNYFKAYYESHGFEYPF